MPVSPQDFELYSRMTGAPMPSDAMSRMQMAPEVYQFTKNFARKPNILEKTGNLLKTVGKIGAYGLGMGMQQSQAAEQRLLSEKLRNETAKTDVALATDDNPIEEETSAPELTAVEKGELAKQETARVKTDEQIRLEQARAKLNQKAKEKAEEIETFSIPRGNRVIGEGSNDIDKLFARTTKDEIYDFPKPLTTADNYNQDRVENQTSTNIIDKKIEQGSQIADETRNIAEVLSESEESRPSEFSDPKEVQQQMESDMVGASATSKKVADFFKQKGLDKVLAAAGALRLQQQELIDDKSPLVDHPDIIGGEDDSDLPGNQNLQVNGTSTSSTVDLKEHQKEMRRMDAEERRGGAKIDKRVGKNLLEQRAIANEEAINSGFMSMTGEERAKETNRFIGQRAKDQMLEQMKKNDEDEERIKKLNLNQDRPTTTTPEQEENFKKLVAAQELQKVFPESQDRSLLDPLGVLNDPKFMGAVRKGQNKARLESNLVSDKVDDFTAKFVEGARSDIVRGRRGNRSLGITRIPATNGDAQVGFVLANKPLDKSPTTATTYGFGVAPRAEGLLNNQLNQESFSDYMQRGLGEAKEGKKRKAGEIFEFLPPSARVVSGTARLGDIVM